MPITNRSPWFSKQLLCLLFILTISSSSLVAAGPGSQGPAYISPHLSSTLVSTSSEPPRLLTQTNSSRALALEATTLRTEPFPVCQLINFGADSGTRLLFFATNIDATTAGNLDAFSADAEDGNHRVYALQVEHVNKESVSETYAIHVRLNDLMLEDGDVLVRLYINGIPTNRVRVGLGHVGGGLPDDGGPQLSELSPSSFTVGSGDFLLSISGSTFTNGSKLYFNGSEHSVTFGSANLLFATVSLSDFPTGGTYAVTVQSSALASNSIYLTGNNPQSAVTALSPSNVIKGASGFTLSVSGSRFVQGSVVNFNGSNRLTTFVSATLLTAQILASDVGSAGSFPVKVVNAAPGGGTSVSASFVVAQPAPSPTPTPTPSPTPTPTTGSQFYVATNGTPIGDGSLQRPWDIATALAQPAAVKPGDTIWVRGGTYRPTLTLISRLTGSSNKYITVRGYPGERATIDGGIIPYRYLRVDGAWIIYQDLEVMSSAPTRSYPDSLIDPGIRRGTGIDVFAPHSKFINLVVHDAGLGIGFWDQAQDAEAYGCIIYNNGLLDTSRGHGPGMYIQNQAGAKLIKDVIVFNNFSSGLRGYGQDGRVINLTFDGVTSFNNGSPAARGTNTANMTNNLFVGPTTYPADNITIDQAFLFHRAPTRIASLALGLGTLTNEKVAVTNSHIVGGRIALNFGYWTTVNMNNNLFYVADPFEPTFASVQNALTGWTWNANSYFDNTGDPVSLGFAYNSKIGLFGGYLKFSEWKSYSGFDANSTLKIGRPTTTEVFVRPNQYDSNRAHIIIYNWQLLNTVTVNVSGVLQPGMQYEVRNVQDYYGAPVLIGTYDGQPIRLPMTGLKVAKPIGYDFTPENVAPEFNTFVLIRR
jgi:hypothetical protein